MPWSLTPIEYSCVEIGKIASELPQLYLQSIVMSKLSRLIIVCQGLHGQEIPKPS